ncbi:coiled-coil domain-containing protein 157-like isoform X2 [Pomacea canaliculata]|uniref:coiled-coil domain-containing protein 157-like isoform X2 n=1 Tax=Pomacea canaliculata TaxID=400727 RepID=UPI000D731658|nr:coiled-coil domain-containing protein 157-like isoform X2 [Pomacea canaliculata]
MADLLGNRLCMENLQSDIQDVQWIINDVSSRTGPIKLSSWKFPDKLSWELDTEELLQTYGYAPDETEENQVAHIALYELLIDRLVSFIQGTAIYLNQIQHLDKASDNASAPPTSVGLAVRHFWDQLVNAQTVILQLYSQNKSNATKISELEKTIKNLSSQHAHLSSKSSFATHFLDQESQYYKSSDVKTISHDEISKSCQTVETAFVPCESCDLVQKKMRESGDLIIQVCQKQGLPSCLRKYRSQLADVKWLSSNDVSRWMAEENKDVQRLCKHIECVSNVIEPLKAEVTAFQQETQKAEKVAKECERALNLEKETQEAIKKQYEIKLKKTQIEHEFILADLECQKKELLLKHTNLEKVLEDHKIKSSELQISLEQTEAKCLELKRDLQNKTEAVERLESVENEVESLRQELSEVTSKLEVATKTLTKEQGKNKSAAQHNQQVKTKQNMLSERISELNEENENLREQVGALEEESQHLEESLQEARREAQQMQKEKANQEVIIKNLNAEKAELERCIEETEAQIKELEVQVEQAKERERMLIEYPDLNGPVNPDLHGTGDIATDMENQVKANIMRIQVLEDLNERLRRSITKVLSAGLGTSASSNSVPKFLYWSLITCTV